MMDVPLGPMSEPERLAEVAARSRQLHTGTRALAAGFVMHRVCALLPPPMHAWFARHVYGGRFFQAVVSNMPGPDVELSLAGVPLLAAYPVLPLAPRTPLTVGALGWHGWLCVGVCTDPLVADAARLAATMGEVIQELCAAGAPASLAAAGEGIVADGGGSPGD